MSSSSSLWPESGMRGGSGGGPKEGKYAVWPCVTFCGKHALEGNVHSAKQITAGYIFPVLLFGLSVIWENRKWNAKGKKGGCKMI